MLPGFFDHQADVRDLTTYAIVRGVRRDIESVRLDRELSNDMPDSVAGGSGLAGNTGTITWSNTTDVTDKEYSPWHQEGVWPPEPGDEVRIYVSDGTTAWPRFTGVIDKTRGTVGGSMVSDIIDFRDQLNEPFTMAAMSNEMPPVSSGGPRRLVELQHYSIITLLLRKIGLYSTPNEGANAVLSVPFQGTAWATVGTVTAAHGIEDNRVPLFYNAPWGFSVGQLYARYAPRTISGNTITSAVQVGFLVSLTHSGNSRIRLVYGADVRVTLRIWPNRRVTAFWDGTPIADLSATQMVDATRVMLLIRDDAWTLRTNTGQQATGTQVRTGTDTMSEIQVDNEAGARLAGLTIVRPSASQDFRDLYFAPDVTFESSQLVGRMTMSPRMENENIADTIDTICKATLTAGWWDETGILRFVATDRLYNQVVAQTVTTADDILAASWEASLLHTRSAVHVEWKSAAISKSRQQRIELWRGSSGTMSSGDVLELFATPGNDEEWFGVDRSPSLLTDANWGAYASGLGSRMGVHYTDENGELPTSTATTTFTVEQIGTAGVKIIHEAGSYPSGVQANLSVSEESPNVRAVFKGDNLPVIRGYFKGVWIDETYVSSITEDSNMPHLVHDMGCWAGEESAQQLGDFLAQRVARVNPTIDRLSVTYDPRRQLGDVINVVLGILGVTLRAMIIGISEEHEHGDHQQHLTLRIIDATSDRDISYHELRDAWAGSDLNALQAVWLNLTNQDFQDDPLRFAPLPQPAPWSPPSGPKYADVNRVWGPQGYDQMRTALAHESYATFPRELLEGDSI